MSDPLEFQGILYPSNFECFRRKRTFSTATLEITQNPPKGRRKAQSGENAWLQQLMRCIMTWRFGLRF